MNTQINCTHISKIANFSQSVFCFFIGFCHNTILNLPQKNTTSLMLKKYFFHEEWNTGIIAIKPLNAVQDIQNYLTDDNTHWLNKKFHFQADPFIVEHEQLLYVFYEALNHTWVKGHLRCRVLRIEDNHSLLEMDDFALEDINALGCHLSFPHIFMFEGEFYLIPESHELANIVLFKAVQFPYQWVLCDTLVSHKKLVDSIFMTQDDGFYVLSSEHKTNQLVVHFSEHTSKQDAESKSETPLERHWQLLTTQSKTLADTNNRLAGALIAINNQHYLPFQEKKSQEYGKSIFIKKITQLNQHHYQETNALHITAFSAQYPDGIHTLNMAQNFMVIDAKRWVYQPFNFFVRKYRQVKTKVSS